MKIYFCSVKGKTAHQAGRELLFEAVKREFGVFMTEEDICYEEKGKPFFKDRSDICFNISHSGEFAVCVLAEEAVGIDVQKNKKISEAVCKRFLNSCPVSEGVREWTKREAYGKYTGGGALDNFMSEDACLKEYFISEGYFLFVCCKSGAFPDTLIRI
ncbi:MAG: hypothetical protein E7623_01500 [Ruminococcaceae bacterium]|nr:hypothetical protein [Oscillospiraceae bacterium]